MRKSIAALGIVLPALLAVSCGQSASVYPGNAPSAPASNPASCPSKPLSISEQDNGKTFCVGTNSEIAVLLHGTPQELWTRPQVDANQNMLASKASGKLMVPLGGTAAYFSADHPGTAHLRSSRPNCPAAAPGSMMCHSMQGFDVTIQIT